MQPPTAFNPPDHLRRIADLDLNILAPLLALIEEESVTGAAARMGVSQSAMSHTLARCRRSLDDPLLVRAGRKSKLTPFASQLRAPLIRALHDLTQNIFDSRAFDAGTERTVFSIAASTTTTLVLAPLLIDRVAERAPGVRLHFRSPVHFLEDPTYRSDLDLAIVPDAITVRAPRERLFVDRWVLVCDRSNRSIRPGFSLRDLAAVDHIAFEVEGVNTPPYRALEALGISVTIRVRVDDFAIVPTMVVGTSAVAIVQASSAWAMRKHNDFVVHELPFEVPPLGLDMVWNRRWRSVESHRWLRDMLFEVIAQFEAEIERDPLR